MNEEYPFDNQELKLEDGLDSPKVIVELVGTTPINVNSSPTNPREDDMDLVNKEF